VTCKVIHLLQTFSNVIFLYCAAAVDKISIASCDLSAIAELLVILGVTNHISETAEISVVRFCTHVGYTKFISQHKVQTIK